jgi:hypothetical protein
MAKDIEKVNKQPESGFTELSESDFHNELATTGDSSAGVQSYSDLQDKDSGDNDLSSGFSISTPLGRRRERPPAQTATTSGGGDVPFTKHFTLDPSKYTTNTALESMETGGDMSLRSAHNRAPHLHCEFGNPSGAHSENRRARDLVYANDRPTGVPEVPMAACAYHSGKIREKLAKDSTSAISFKPIISESQVERHRMMVDMIKKDSTLSAEGDLLNLGMSGAEALSGRETEGFYTAAPKPRTTALEEATSRRPGIAFENMTSGGEITSALEELGDYVKKNGGRVRSNDDFTEVKDDSVSRWNFPTKSAMSPGEVRRNQTGSLTPGASHADRLNHVLTLKEQGVPNWAEQGSMLGITPTHVHRAEAAKGTSLQNFQSVDTQTYRLSTVGTTATATPQQLYGGGSEDSVTSYIKAKNPRHTYGVSDEGELTKLSDVGVLAMDKMEEAEKTNRVAIAQNESAEKLRQIERFKTDAVYRRARIAATRKGQLQDFNKATGQTPPPIE